MKSILYTTSQKTGFYNDSSFLGKIKDRFRLKLKEEIFIKELKLEIKNVKFPPNINIESYNSNILRAKKISGIRDMELAPKVYRYLDYNLYNKFQRELMAFSIIKSLKVILRIKKKSIRHSCIVVYDASEKILFDTICYLAREAKDIILLSKDIMKTKGIGQYIIVNYGITPIITSDMKFSFESADFVISSKNVTVKSDAYVWYIDNSYIPSDRGVIVNDVSYKVPWNCKYNGVSFELLGSILCQMNEKNVEKSLSYNGIFLDKIKFNEDMLVL
ncbi:hypothetical protein CLRAG_04630 [Clostridium ragsdalei P11]|uniref:Uncharacterized protein n=1 Tax=Clostridium ragsdalei P11 TaxID=1353534 RepID=A0A1A6B233_9CLOT|nr:hypothetical protein [Clostridium ragsdalei]OBR96347.1 hypothetical protein CLRAG_04630 [Clostridium ragsdalei P11]